MTKNEASTYKQETGQDEGQIPRTVNSSQQVPFCTSRMNLGLGAWASKHLSWKYCAEEKKVFIIRLIIF
jgi:hypothetical protein